MRSLLLSLLAACSVQAEPISHSGLLPAISRGVERPSVGTVGLEPGRQPLFKEAEEVRLEGRRAHVYKGPFGPSGRVRVTVEHREAGSMVELGFSDGRQKHKLRGLRPWTARVVEGMVAADIDQDGQQELIVVAEWEDGGRPFQSNVVVDWSSRAVMVLETDAARDLEALPDMESVKAALR